LSLVSRWEYSEGKHGTIARGTHECVRHRRDNGGMARIEGIADKQANVFTRSFYGAVRRKLGRVPEPIRITAHQPRLLAALGGMEMAEEAMRTVDPVVKALAGIKTAMLIGCPF
jgi:hypothetical protein